MRGIGEAIILFLFALFCVYLTGAFIWSTFRLIDKALSPIKKRERYRVIKHRHKGALWYESQRRFGPFWLRLQSDFADFDQAMDDIGHDREMRAPASRHRSEVEIVLPE